MAPMRGRRNGKSVGPVQGSASGLRTCPFKFFHECKDGKPGRGCKHDNEVVLFAINSGDVEDFIVGIRKPCQVVVDTNPRHPAGLAGSNWCFAQSGSVARISRKLGPIAFTSALHLAGG
ncbi:hypothetical protein R6Q59_028318 [Mikania micrantha]